MAPGRARGPGAARRVPADIALVALIAGQLSGCAFVPGRPGFEQSLCVEGPTDQVERAAYRELCR